MVKNRNAAPDGEIEIIDIFLIAWKWKWFVVIGSLMLAIVAGVISYNLPRIYRMEMVLRPGITQVMDNGNYLYLDSEENLKALIDAGTFNLRILTELHENKGSGEPVISDLRFGVKLTNKTMQISYNTPQPEQGKFVLDCLFSHLIAYYEPMVKRFRRTFELRIREEENARSKLVHEISRLKNEIKSAQNALRMEIRLVENEIDSLEAGMAAQANVKENERRRVAEIEEEIERTSKNTNDLIDQRTAFLKNIDYKDHALSSIIYTNTIQQNISSLDILKAQRTEALNRMSEAESAIAGYRLEIKKSEVKLEEARHRKQAEIENLNVRIQDLQSDQLYRNEKISDLEFKRASVENIQQLQEPVRSPKPVSPRLLLNVVLVFVGSFVVLLFISFLAEYVIRTDQ